jgi:glycosyltransferase involved in cell wall biosynthesis
VHLHDPELLPLGMLLQVGGCPVVYDVHEDYRGVIGTRRWIPRALRAPSARVFAWLEAAASREFAAVVAATPPIALLFPEARTTLVQNFPREHEFVQMAPEARASDHHAFVYVGAITERRGVDTMVRALELTRRDARLLLAGSFRPAALRAEMESRPGWERVRFEGWADRTKVGRLLAEARAGLVVFKESPNQPESQPNKLFEYMLCELPVIASDFPYWRSMVGAADACLFVDPEDPGSVAAAMDWVVENPDEAADMGRRGRQAVLQRFNWASEEVRLLELYTRLLAAGRREG